MAEYYNDNAVIDAAAAAQDEPSTSRYEKDDLDEGEIVSEEDESRPKASRRKRSPPPPPLPSRNGGGKAATSSRRYDSDDDGYDVPPVRQRQRPAAAAAPVSRKRPMSTMEPPSRRSGGGGGGYRNDRVGGAYGYRNEKKARVEYDDDDSEPEDEDDEPIKDLFQLLSENQSNDLDRVDGNAVLLNEFQGNQVGTVAAANVPISTRSCRSAYSLLARLDIDKIFEDLQISDKEEFVDRRKNITELVNSIKMSLWRLSMFAKEHDVKIELSEIEHGKLVDSMAANTRPNQDIIAATEENKAAIQQQLHKLIGQVDIYTRLLLRHFSIQRGTAYCEDFESAKNTLVLNFMSDTRHMEYLMSTISRGRATSSSKKKRMSLDAYFVISIHVDIAKNCEYAAAEERSGVWKKLIDEYVRKVVFKNSLPANMEIFGSIAMRKNCADFDCLLPLSNGELNNVKPMKKDGAFKSQHCDKSGVLALINLAFMEIAKYKNGRVNGVPRANDSYVNVKAYIIATCSSLVGEK